MASALPWVKPRYFDSNGHPLVCGKVYTYVAGSSTPLATYTDSGGLTANPNPYILDADGYGDIWMKPGSYKIVLTDKNDVVIWMKDNVKPADGGGGGIVDADHIRSSFDFTQRFRVFDSERNWKSCYGVNADGNSYEKI